VLSAFTLGCTSAGTQEKGKPDQSVSEARKIPPFPPKDVSVERKDKQVIVNWKPIPLDNIVAYKIYRKTRDSKFEYIGTAKHPPFVDHEAPSANVTYTVTAVNTYQAESSFAKPAEK